MKNGGYRATRKFSNSVEGEVSVNATFGFAGHRLFTDDPSGAE